MERNGQLTLDWVQPEGKTKTGTITVRCGDDSFTDRLDITKASAREAFLAQVAARMPVLEEDEPRRDVRRKLEEIAASESERAFTTSKPEGHESAMPDAEELLAGMPEFVRADGRAMLEDPQLLSRILDDIASLGVAGERELAATVYLVGTSRLLAKPLAAIVTGHTSSGKSYVPEQVARMFPSETLLMATQQTPTSLFYLKPGSLRHLFIIAGERSRAHGDDNAEATRALREMLSSGKLSKLVTMKVNGEMQSVLIEQEGPIAYVEGTTATTIFDEDANRCLLLATDERKEQTRRIVTTLAARSAGELTGDKQRIIDRHHAAQRMLKQKTVVIPFAPRLAELFASDRVEARRAFPHLLSMIEAIASLHQLQRTIDADGRLVATQDDYQIARHLLATPFSRQLGGGVSDGARRFVERLQCFGQREFSSTDAHQTARDEFSRRAVTGWLLELCEADLVEQVEPSRGSKPARWRRTERNPEDAEACPALPTLERVFS